MLGEIDFDDNHIDPREFTMTVDSTVSKRTVMETIAHEMVPSQAICPRESWWI